MSEWKEYNITQVCDTISDTYRESAQKVVLINTSDVLEGKVTNHEYVPNKNLAGQFKKKFQKDDILYSEIRPANRRYAYVDFEPKDYIASTKLMVLRSKPCILPKYLYYLLTNNTTIRNLHAIAVGRSGTFPQITYSELANIKFLLPPIEEQEKILSTLLDFDDKIAVNRRICENLEAQAQELFKHWFIDFAPFKDGNFVDSELGMIPLSELCEQITDGVHNSIKDEPLSDYMLLSCKNIVGGVLSKNAYRSISKDTFEKLRKRTKLAQGDILLSSVGTIGEIAIVEDDPLDFEFQRSVAIIKPKKTVGTYYIYNALLANKVKLQHSAHGAVQQCLFIGDLKKFEVHWPDKTKAYQYNETVKPLYMDIASLHKENLRLATLRDTLLPKLMSGQIKV